jgi:hypothetical protein
VKVDINRRNRFRINEGRVIGDKDRCKWTVRGGMCTVIGGWMNRFCSIVVIYRMGVVMFGRSSKERCRSE